MIATLLGALVGAVGFRLKGSAIFEQITGRGATTARIVCWAIPMGILSLYHVPWQYAFLVGLGFFLYPTVNPSKRQRRGLISCVKSGVF